MTIAMDGNDPHKYMKPDMSQAQRVQRSKLTPIDHYSTKASSSDIFGYRDEDGVVMLVKSPIMSIYDAAYMESFISFLERARLCLAGTELAHAVNIPEHSPIWVDNGAYSKLSLQVRHIPGRTLGDALKFQFNLKDTPEQQNALRTLVTVATDTLKYLDQLCINTIGLQAADRRTGAFGDDFENFVIPAQHTQGDNFSWRFTDPAQVQLVNVDPICHSRYYNAISTRPL